MGRTQLRLAVWALAILTSFAIFGEHTALASGNNPKVEGGGWFPTPNPDARNGTAKANFGITGKFDKNGMTEGNFEYHNETSGLKAHGKLTVLAFHTVCDPALSTCTDACGFFAPQLIGKPAATVGGQCDNASCSFSMDVIDGGDPGKFNDYVCNVMVTGPAKNNTVSTDADPAEPLGGGNIKIKNN